MRSTFSHCRKKDNWTASCLTAQNNSTVFQSGLNWILNRWIGSTSNNKKLGFKNQLNQNRAKKDHQLPRKIEQGLCQTKSNGHCNLHQQNDKLFDSCKTQQKVKTKPWDYELSHDGRKSSHWANLCTSSAGWAAAYLKAICGSTQKSEISDNRQEMITWSREFALLIAGIPHRYGRRCKCIRIGAVADCPCLLRRDHSRQLRLKTSIFSNIITF